MCHVADVQCYVKSSVEHCVAFCCGGDRAGGNLLPTATSLWKWNGDMSGGDASGASYTDRPTFLIDVQHPRNCWWLLIVVVSGVEANGNESRTAIMCYKETQ